MKFGGKKTKAINFENGKPMVCILDMEKDACNSIVGKAFNLATGTAGNLIRVNNEKEKNGRWVKLNFDIPENLHEYDVLIIDLSGGKEIVECKKFSYGDGTGGKIHAIYSGHPEIIFNPRPGGFKAIGKELNVLLEKPSVVVIFADAIESADYRTVEVSSGGNRWGAEFSADTTELYERFPNYKNMVGTKIKAPGEESEYFELLEKHFDGGQYRVVFEHPTYLRNYQKIKSSSFTPVALNERDEIVSYVHKISNGYVFVFPQVINKVAFIGELFSSYLSQVFPAIFSGDGKLSWIDSGQFPVPGELELIERKKQIEEEYHRNLLKNEQELIDVKNEYSFLRKLLSETGDALVDAVAEYFKWLEFDSVINYDDENPVTLEEDLQVDCGDRLLVVEVKGLGGTSTDKACSQITKIKHRRMKQRQSFEVYGLYIVNHQRHVSPDKRSNPPFTANQLEDAVSDERGLLTTYQMYQAFFMIKDGLLSKKDVRDNFFQFGLVSLVPNSIRSLGVPIKYFMDCKVVVVDLAGSTLKVGDTILAKKNSEYKKHTVVSMMKDDVSVEVVTGGEVGVNVGEKVERNSEIWVYV